ncbi:MAG: hypothetical protein IJZ74_10695 [Clostridia bacterium]|nr:hypothetical protein [Clostridia bacterium]
MTQTDRSPAEQLQALCALIPPLCILTADPAVQHALDNMAEAPQPASPALMKALSAHTAELQRIAALHDLNQRRLLIDHELLALMYVCRQCTAEELLTILTSCTVPPTAEGLALLASAHRQQQARQQYGLQLLWRILGDEAIPDALSLFSRPSRRSMQDVRADLLRRINKEAFHD